MLYYLIFINIIAFLIMGVDKDSAERRKWRTAEKTLFILAIIGGSLGIWLGIYFFRHKIKKEKFYIGIPIIFFIQLYIIL